MALHCAQGVFVLAPAMIWLPSGTMVRLSSPEVVMRR